MRSHQFLAETKAAASDKVRQTIQTRYFPEIWYALENWLTESPSRSVLEIGTGLGLFSEAFAKSGWRVTCIDPSLKSLMRVQRRFTAGDIHGRFEQAEPEKIPLKNDCFDALISVNMLEFCESPRKAIKEMYRILRPGGRGVIATFNRASPWGFPFVARMIRDDHPPRSLNFIGRRDLLGLLRYRGFDVDRLQGRAHYLPVTTRLSKFRLPIAGCHVVFFTKPRASRKDPRETVIKKK